MLVVGMCLLIAQHTYADVQPTPEYAVKAAFLYNFGKFVEWSDDRSPLTVCIFGIDPFGSALDPLHGKSLKGRPLLVKRGFSNVDLTECHILYISRSAKAQFAQILSSVKNRQILTVSDIENFAQSGGMIALVNVANKIQLEINLDATQQAGLKVSSQLLKLSKIVQSPQ